MMARWTLFYRLMVRPLVREPLRPLLTAIAVALGVAVVLAIELAGGAAAGSFHSSLEALTGDADFSVTAAGGVPGDVLAMLARLPYALRTEPRIEDFATVLGSGAIAGQTIALFGVDVIAQSNQDTKNPSSGIVVTRAAAQGFSDLDAVWLSSNLGYQPGGTIELQINDHAGEYKIAGIFQAGSTNERMAVMDLSLADRELGRHGRLDEILLRVSGGQSAAAGPDAESLDSWAALLRATLPPGAEIREAGSRTVENRKMLSAFRWNLRVLSYIALVVGAFLIYNTISVSVVRRRPQIGVVRALGASRGAVLAAFLGEAGCYGVVGALLGCVLGRIMAGGALSLLSATVNSLYVSSRPGALAFTWTSLVIAFCIGIGMSVVAAWSPAREAAGVSPTEAMARGRKEYAVRVRKQRDFWIALLLAVFGVAACFAPPLGAKPLFGYLAALLFIGASALAMPAFVSAVTSASSRWLQRLMGVEALLAARILTGSLRRTSVLVGALATAIAMITSVGIMVGSFRETVQIWMDNQLQADFYLRPAGSGAADQHPTLDPAIVAQLRHVPGVAAVDQFRAYEISYEELPATLGSADLQVARTFRQSVFISGRPAAAVYGELLNSDAAVISEPFANKHHLRRGASIALPIGNSKPIFTIADVYYDYGSEGGYIIVDRERLLKYLPDPAPSNLAIYLSPGADPQLVRSNLDKQTAGRRIVILSNGSLRGEALQIFDRTFAITYALEAVSIVVAIIGIAGALLALVIDRRREFGLLRFLGASAVQIRKLILFEAGLIGLLANAAGLMLGYALSLVLIYVINKQSFGWTINFHLPALVLVGSLTLVYGVTVVAGLYPARVAIRLSPIDVVHEE